MPRKPKFAHLVSQAAIDKLPETQRQLVLNAMLEGQPARKVAAIAGISRQAVCLYKKNRFLPSLRASMQAASNHQVTNTDGINNEPTIQRTVELTRGVISSSPFRAQLASLKDRTERLLDCAESGIRARDDGKPNTADAAACAPLIAQAHKNVELLGRATGELEQAAGPQIAVQIVIPASQGLPDVLTPAADISCSVRGTGRE